ncbi:MAG: superoxide dismutase family protein [Polyangiaceae bacterium]
MKAEIPSLMSCAFGARARFLCALGALVATPLFGCAGQHRNDNTGNAQGTGATGDTSGSMSTSGANNNDTSGTSGQYGQGNTGNTSSGMNNGNSGATGAGNTGMTGTGNTGMNSGTGNSGVGQSGSGSSGSKQMTVTLDSKSGSKTTGTATFTTDASGKVTLKIDLKNAPPGVHGVHIHDVGDCSSTDAESAGPHWNPNKDTHGKMGRGHHMGDIGNITVGADGTGTLTIASDQWTLGAGGMNDVSGHAVVVHLKADDFATQPSGGSGSRIACGVIKK